MVINGFNVRHLSNTFEVLSCCVLFDYIIFHPRNIPATYLRRETANQAFIQADNQVRNNNSERCVLGTKLK